MTSLRPDTNLCITATLTMSAALQGAVTVDNDGSSLDAGRMGCTQPDISGLTTLHISGTWSCTITA